MGDREYYTSIYDCLWQVTPFFAILYRLKRRITLPALEGKSLSTYSISTETLTTILR
jgi:hypothetical protein